MSRAARLGPVRLSRPGTAIPSARRGQIHAIAMARRQGRAYRAPVKSRRSGPARICRESKLVYHRSRRGGRSLAAFG
jgi:hypothetical protein